MKENEVLQFNNGGDKLLKIAKQRRDGGDLVGALSVLLSIENNGTHLTEVYAEIASIYTEMELNAMSVNYWFKYLTLCPKSEMARAYNALGANYYFMNNMTVAGYYFEKQIDNERQVEQEFDEVMYEYYDNVCAMNKPDIYICYPPRAVGTKRIIEEGDEYFYSKKFLLAAERFSDVKPTDDDYSTAQIKVAAALFCHKDYDGAIFVIKRLIARDSTDKQAIINMLGMLFATDKREEADKYFELAEKLEFDNSIECYKLATSFLDAGYDEKGKKYLRLALEKDKYELNSMYLLGLVHFNLKDFDRAAFYLSDVYKITRSPIAKYYYKLALDVKSNKCAYKRLNYIFNVPKPIISEWISKLNSVVKGGTKAVMRENKSFLIELADWSFSFNEKLQEEYCETLLSTTNVQIRKFYIEQLLNTSLSDSLKTLILTKLIERGYDKKVGLVLGNIFVKLQLYRGDFSREKGALFLRAYSLAFGKIAAFGADKAVRIREAAYDLYYKLIENGNVRKINDEKSLAAAIALSSKLISGTKKSAVCGYFNVEVNRVNEIIALAKEKE